MDKGLRVVGFTFSNHRESTLNAETSCSKLQTQRSLLSELLAQYAIEGDEDDSTSSQDVDCDDVHTTFEEGCGGETAPVARQDTYGDYQKSSPILIPCAESFAKQRAKDAYCRLLYQRQVEQLYYQQQQQLQYQVQQQYLLQRQRQMQLIQQQQQRAAQASLQQEQDCEEVAQPCGPASAVPVY